MTLLSGGVQQMGASTDYNYGLSTGQYAAPVNYGGLLAGGIQQFYDAVSGPGYYAPQPAYTVPVYQPSNYSYNYSSPTNVNYSPVEVSNNSINADAPTFNPVGPSAVSDAPGGIRIGHTTYSPDQLLASNPALSFAPGGVASRIPQYDTRSDSANGYDITARPATGSDQGLSAQADSAAQPDALAAPDIQQQQGIPNPFRQPPMAPNYFNGDPNQAIMSMPDNIMNAMPQRSDYYPSAQSMARPSNPFARALWAMPGQARQRAGAVAAAEAAFNGDANRMATLMGQIGPGVIGAQREIMQQQGADYRLNQQTFNQGALAALNFGFDQKEKQILSLKDGLNLAAQAFQLPSFINGQPNREKLLMLNTAGRQLGWSPRDIDALFGQQDFNAAQQMKQEALRTEAAAFALQANREKLKAEINILTSQAAQNFAQARLMGAQAGRIGFDLSQDQKIARDLRLQKLAQISQDIGKQVEEKSTRNQRIEEQKLKNRDILAGIIKKQMDAASVPAEIGTRLAQAMATMSSSFDPNTRAAAMGLQDSVYSALGIGQKPVVNVKPDGTTTTTMMPVDSSDMMKKLGAILQQGQPGYRQRMPQSGPPAQYFTGQPLAGNGNQNGTPMSYQQSGEN